jgi:hypothetical protein
MGSREASLVALAVRRPQVSNSYALVSPRFTWRGDDQVMAD